MLCRHRGVARRIVRQLSGFEHQSDVSRPALPTLPKVNGELSGSWFAEIEELTGAVPI